MAEGQCRAALPVPVHVYQGLATSLSRVKKTARNHIVTYGLYRMSERISKYDLTFISFPWLGIKHDFPMLSHFNLWSGQ